MRLARTGREAFLHRGLAECAVLSIPRVRFNLHSKAIFLEYALEPESGGPIVVNPVVSE